MSVAAHACSTGILIKAHGSCGGGKVLDAKLMGGVGVLGLDTYNAASASQKWSLINGPQRKPGSFFIKSYAGTNLIHTSQKKVELRDHKSSDDEQLWELQQEPGGSGRFFINGVPNCPCV